MKLLVSTLNGMEPFKCYFNYIQNIIYILKANKVIYNLIPRPLCIPIQTKYSMLLT